MTERNENEPFWTAEEVGVFLRMHPQTVYLKAREGEIPSYKIGGKRLFKPAEIREWADREGSSAPAEKVV